MKKLMITILCFVSSCAFASKTLNIYNWSSLMPDYVLKQFKDETGITVNLTEFDNNATMYAKIVTTNGKGYDIVFPSNFYVKRMAKQNLLQRIDKSKLPNIKNLDKRFLNLPNDPNNQYSLPFVWSTSGIVVNKKFFDPKSVKNIVDLWEPRFKNQLLVIDDARDVFSAVLLALGYSINDVKPEHIKQAFEKLKTLLPNVRLFNSVAVTNLLIDEDVHAAYAWSGDVSVAQDENPNLVYVYPEKGFVIELDTMCIIKNAENLENAYKFVNFLMRPDIAAKITAEYRYVTPNPPAIKLLPEKLRNNPIINPEKSVLKRGEFQKDIGETNELLEKYWEELKISS